MILILCLLIGISQVKCNGIKGYKRIHKVLVKEGFEVGKSPNCVNSMIKKRLKREEFLNQKDLCEYKEFKIMGMKSV